MNQLGSSIHLAFRRHAPKNQQGTDLSEAGKDAAQKLNFKDIVGISSEVPRAKLTACLATHPETKSTKDIEEELCKIRSDPRLGFNIGEKSSSFYTDLYKAYEEGNLSTFLIESDKYLEDDSTYSTYSKVAGDFAEMILEYYKIISHATKKGRIQNTPKEFKRLLVSHQGVLELLLFKIIENRDGKEGLKKFIEDNNLQQGFNFLEGYDVFIYDNGIKLTFRSYEYDITIEDLGKIIKQRDKLYKN